ncbi:M23 family metallopeptidase [Pseudactinotalea sp. HY158]|uniref:M23 family metallopeptidase n=1 Tax=Pseudactinotalea sp. HY158 TaxID=2654547 RepID=UPI00129CDBDB|nr:M23 family metallopeptidase [Pseudactinotalea sp. HY158]QGH68616.1 peptidoglycan DD-metalloendopeptidase family protein [Pseudactinotalea sp. HY158]
MTAALLALYRVRGLLYYAACLVLVANAVILRTLDHDLVDTARGAAVNAALIVGAVAVIITFAGPRLLPAHAPRTVPAPVHGRWLALNSPATKVPSHGVRAYGQAYAIDLVHEPHDRPRPSFGGRGPMRRPQEYPAFGRPVHAMADGVVVRAARRHRDHRSRSNLLAVGYLMIEGMIREIGGPSFLLGNHVTIRTDDGVFATVAHLQRHSVTVRVGEAVTAGTVIGRCGNSGNSSEPHVHAQLMDRASLRTAHGLPMAFAGVTLGEGPGPVDGLPGNGEHMDTEPQHLALRE